ncbi:MAG TPA: phospholipase D family protein [Armatimonadota bacterium]|jgi:phosphatidylserine/phosphatidylglycerophosphate/cardiolipin synthase-like enzyme
MRRHLLSLIVLVVAVVLLGLALPGLRMPPAATAPEAAGHRPEAGATGNQTAATAQTGDIQPYFSRRDDPRGAVLAALGSVRSSAVVAMYTFTDHDLAAALIAAQRRGAAVSVYLDRSQAAQKVSVARELVQAGVPVRISSNRHIMHNKFAVLDGATVITGSYNWTHAASQDNDENLLVMHRADMAQSYTRRFTELWSAWDPALTEALKSPLGPSRRPEYN